MTAQQKQLTALVVLIGVMVAVYARARRSPSPSSPAAEAPVTADEAAPSPRVMALPVLEASSQREAQQRRTAELTWNRDPFNQGQTAAHVSGLELSGIMWDANEPVAIINGEMLHVGEERDGYRILEIAHDHVSVTDGTQTLQLFVAP